MSPPPTPDPYAALGLPRTATSAQIKAAYRKLALLYHPDSAGPNPRWHEVNVAYEVLSEPSRRARYDGGLDAKLRVASHRDHANAIAGEVSARLHIGEPPSPPRGTDVSVVVAARGPQTVRYQRYAPCTRCRGSGEADNSGWLIWCKRCAGAGEYEQKRWVWQVWGWVSGLCRCERCAGSGVQIATRCDDCAGNGRVLVTERIEVDVPAKGRWGRLQGWGNAGIRGCAAGCLLVAVGDVPTASAAAPTWRVQLTAWLHRARRGIISFAREFKV